MGYQVEYLAKLEPVSARKWLSRFDGFWIEPESDEDLPYAELRLWNDIYLHVDLGKVAARFSIPQIKYSWLLRQHQPAIAVIERFEQLIVETMPFVPFLRLDEMIWEDWEKDAGSWDKLADPVESLCRSLVKSNQEADYFRIFPTPSVDNNR